MHYRGQSYNDPCGTKLKQDDLIGEAQVWKPEDLSLSFNLCNLKQDSIHRTELGDGDLAPAPC